MDEASDQSPAPQACPRWRAALRRVTGGVLALAVLLALTLVALDTRAGRSFVARQISGMTFANGLQIRMIRIDGSLYGKARIIGLSAHDTRGQFLRAPAVQLDWRPLAWLRNHIDIRSARAPEVILERVPVFRPGKPDQPLLPDLDIDVGSLRIDRLTTLPAVTGERRELSLAGKARIADRRAQVTAQLATLSAPGGEGGDRLDLVLDAVPERNRLALRLGLEAPKGGVIAALARLNQPLSLRVEGSGDWRTWNGKLALESNGKPRARLALAARNGTFSAKGTAEVATLLGGVPAELLDGVTRVDLTARLDQRRVGLSGEVKSQTLSLVPAGTLDLSDNSFEGFRLDAVLPKPAALAPNLSGQDLVARLDFAGPFARPEVQYRLSAARLTMNAVSLQGLVASGTARIGARETVVPVAAQVARINGLDTIAGGSLERVRLEGDLAFSGSRILSDNMKIRSDRIDANAILLADMAKGIYTGAFEGRINQYVVDSVGTFAVSTTADLRHTGQGLALTGTIRARSTRLFNSSVQSFLGGNAAGSLQLTYGSDGIFRFSRLRLSAPDLQVFDGSGSYQAGGTAKLTARGRSTRYGPLAIELTGTLARPRAVLLAGNPGLGIGLADVRAEILGDQGGYRFAATGQTDFGPLSADVTLLQGQQLALQVNRGDLAGIGFSGRIVRTPTGPFAGELRANGRGVNGTVQLDAAGRYQQARIALQARDTVLPGPARLAIGRAIVDARVVFYDQPLIEADAQLAQTQFRNLNLAAARVQVSYRDGRGQAKFLVEGQGSVPFRLAGNALLAPSLWRASLDGRVRGIAVRTASPARIVPSATGYELLPTRLDFGQGSMRLAGSYGTGLEVRSRMDQLDLAIVNAFFPGYGIGGKATGSLDFTQGRESSFPQAEARLAITGFSRSTAASVSQPVDITFTGKLMPEAGEARAVIRRRGSIVGRMNLTLEPAGPDAGEWTSRVATGGLGGGIRYNGPAETLWSFIGSSDQSLAGPIALAADFSGQLRDPQLKGIVRSETLTYENQTYGTRLTRMAVAGRFSGDKLVLENLTTAAGPGRITGNGSLSLAAASGYPMDMTFELANARLASSDALSSSATGTLRLHKVAGETAVLSGKLRLPETRYELVRQGAADVPVLTGVRFKLSPSRQRITGNEPAPQPGSLISSLRLDLALSAPNELFVTGMGLDSEWSANLRVTGTTRNPLVSGDINLVRGTLGFAGRQFELQEGRLLYNAAAPSDPQIALRASETIDDIDVSINATGRALNPQITFASDPALPPDEVLSRILFGNSVGQLAPLQAVQLAASLNSLRANGGGLNPLGKLRAATGISRLRILAPDEATGRGTAIAAGRYISNAIYIEVITDTRGFTATQMEIGLSKTLSILGQTGGSGANDFNLRYRKRY